jgi:hypothetical protein
MMKWNLLVFGCLLYSLFVTPYLLAFEEISGNMAYFWIEMTLCAMFFIDMVFQFFTAYYDESSELITDNKSIALNYIRTYFWFDLFAVFPWFVFDNDDNIGHAGSILRISRLTRIIYIFRAMKFMKMRKMFGTSSSLSF